MGLVSFSKGKFILSNTFPACFCCQADEAVTKYEVALFGHRNYGTQVPINHLMDAFKLFTSALQSAIIIRPTWIGEISHMISTMMLEVEVLKKMWAAHTNLVGAATEIYSAAHDVNETLNRELDPAVRLQHDEAELQIKKKLKDQ